METRGKIIESDSHQIPKLRKKFKLARLRKKKKCRLKKSARADDKLSAEIIKVESFRRRSTGASQGRCFLSRLRHKAASSDARGLW